MWRFLKSRRVLAAMAIVAGILAAALWPSTVEVDFGRVDRGALQITVDEEGETRVGDRFVISAPVTGRLQRIELEPGDSVERGRTVLARLIPADPALLDARTRAELSAAAEAAQAAVGQARAERARAGAALERAASTLRRQEELASSGLVSRDELEAARIAVRAAEEAQRAAEFSVARAEHDLRMARARIRQPSTASEPLRIVAPIDGVVLKRHRESEGLVAAGEPLLDLGDRDRLEIVADFLSTDAVRISPGNRVLMEQWGGGRALAGRVRLVEPSGFMKISALGVEEQRVNVIIDFSDAASARELGDAYRVEVRVVIWERPDAVKVPVGSLFRRGEDWAVFVVNDGHATLRTIEVGHMSSSEAEVTKGLQSGDTVVLHPPDTLEDGMRVTERGA
ncbi:MAG TPA: efflux RND transporter periplasmic adaptor subunit [Vicinamibacterales bacterium]|nr:efflux RND transporter periplasmic adaptor subunit [Vicinamibacterales bacterium]